MLKWVMMKIEKWAFGDPSILLGLFKIMLVVLAPFILAVVVIVSAVQLINPHEHAVLDLTSTWDCTSSHKESQYVMHGKISRWEEVEVCDNYRMKGY